MDQSFVEKCCSPPWKLKLLLVLGIRDGEALLDRQTDGDVNNSSTVQENIS